VRPRTASRSSCCIFGLELSVRCQRCRHLTRDPRTSGATLSGRGARSSRLIGGAAACQQANGNQLVTKHGYRLMNAQSRTSTMAKRKQIESAGGDPVANPENEPRPGQTELPLVDSPSLSPATPDVASEPVAELPVTLEAAPAVSKTDLDNKEEPTDIAPAAPALARWQHLRLRPRHRRYAMLA